MFGIDKFGKMAGAVKQAKQQQDKMKAIQAFGESRDHLVKVHLNGLQELVTITIDESLLAVNKAKDLKSDIMAAHKDAQQKLQKELMKGMDIEEMKKMLGM
jgi:DNA-binding protein YbaB